MDFLPKILQINKADKHLLLWNFKSHICENLNDFQEGHNKNHGSVTVFHGLWGFTTCMQIFTDYMESQFKC